MCKFVCTQLLRQMEQSVTPASDAEVTRVAQLLMAALAKVEPVPDARHWYKLYRFMECAAQLMLRCTEPTHAMVAFQSVSMLLHAMCECRYLWFGEARRWCSIPEASCMRLLCALRGAKEFVPHWQEPAFT